MGHWQKHITSLADAKAVASESIGFQDKKKLASLAEVVRKFRDAGDFSPAGYQSSGIAAWVFDNNGITVLPRNGSDLGVADVVFAGVEPPKLDANNPIIADLQRKMVQGNIDLDVYSKFLKENELNGEFDDKNAKLSGELSKVPSPLWLTPKLLTGIELTDLEVAAIILHEVGHVYYYFRTLMRTVVTNLIADAAANRMMQTEDPTVRLKVVKDVERMLNTKVNQPETICKEMSKENIYMHLVTDILLERPFVTGSEGFANRTWERAADDFAARFGAAPYLASALYKIETSQFYLCRNASYMNYGVHLMLEMLNVSLLIVASTNPIGLFFTTISVAFGLIVNDPRNTIYDPPQERFETMRRNLVEELNTLKGSTTKEANEHRKRILQGIASIDELLKTVKDKDNVFSFIMKTLTPSGRRERAGVDYQRTMERYLSNDLRVASAKLSQATSS
ncbi:hypothetical protein CGY83_16245 [Salmonella enterica subsp. enterica serovar Enteritidis]|nr:hypothetical protein [Salmonella enterica subsp. enterica serovar Enteritidis]